MGGGWGRVPERPLLHVRSGAAGDVGIHRQRGPDIGKAELSMIRFIAWNEKFRRWLVTAAVTDELMIILLAMQVTVQRSVDGVSTFLWVNWAFAKPANSGTAVKRGGSRLTSNI